jgi:1-acyl-sn-glycerol-3-phosphate acyltransferase
LAGSIGSVTCTDHQKGPCDSYSRGPFTYFGPFPGRRQGILLAHESGAPRTSRPASVRLGVVSGIYSVLHSVVPPLARAIWRPTVIGLENVPPDGGVILASNHLSFVDSVVIPCVVPRKVVFLAKSDYFTGPGVKGALSRAWFEGLGMLPVDRDDSKAAIASLDTALEVLGRGEAFGIYPEGTRSRDGRLYRGRTGVAHLALTAGVPVVPVGLTGTQDIQPVGSNLPRLARVTVRFGPAIDVAGRWDGLPLGRARREVTDEIMTAIRSLTGQDLAGGYNERPPEFSPRTG